VSAAAGPSKGRSWTQTLLLALSLGLAGCACEVPELDLGPPAGGCLLGTPCPDGTCVINGFGSWDGCCGFGGECEPCPLGGFECPDGTCALWEAACCAHGGSCDPGRDDPEPGDDDPHRWPGSTGVDTDASASSEDGSSGEATSDGSSDGETGSDTFDTDDASSTSGEAAGGSGSSTG
jgi:hypothetical protein